MVYGLVSVTILFLHRKWVSYRLSMHKTIIALLAVIYFITGCSQAPQGPDSVENPAKVLRSNPDTLLVDTLLPNGAVKVYFNKYDYTLSVSFTNGIADAQEIGNYSGTFGQPPRIEFVSFAGDSIGLMVITNTTQLGQSMDNLALFSLHIDRQSITGLCNAPNIAPHNASQDTLSGISYYSYKVQPHKKVLTITEYLPYKSPGSKFKSISKDYQFVKD